MGERWGSAEASGPGGQRGSGRAGAGAGAERVGELARGQVGEWAGERRGG
jgi:hypothetical protein